MKIEFGSGLGVYRAGKPTGPTHSPKVSERSNTDTVEFSHHTATPTKALTNPALVSSVSAKADSARIEALKQSVRAGTYYVSTDDLVKAILDA